MEYLVLGFFTGLSLILAIGAQNIFVIEQGLKKEHVFLVCFVCSISDLLSTGLSDLNKVNISSLNLDSFNNLKLVMLDIQNNFIDEINVKYNLWGVSRKLILN